MSHPSEHYLSSSVIPQMPNVAVLPTPTYTFNAQVGEILFATLTFIVVFIIFVFIIQFSWNNSLAEIFKDQVKQINLTESFFQENEAFIKNAEMHAWVNEDVKKLSNELAKYERIKNFILKRNPLTIENGEITPTLKTKRKVIETKFSSEIAAMYQDEEMPD